MVKRKYYFLALLFLINFCVAIFSFQTFIVEDAAIHAEIASVIINNNYIADTYMPVTDILITYPPFFHYLSIIISFVLPLITSVRLLGAISYAFLPVAVYFASSVFTKKPLMPAAFSVVIVNLTYILAFAAFPQLMAFNFLLLFIYFFFRKKHWLAGLFAGLTIITHSFTGLFAFSLLFIIGVLYNKKAWKTVALGLGISLLWIKRYFVMLSGAVSNTWNNSHWVEVQGNHFETLRALWQFFGVRLNIVIFVLFLAGLFIFFRNKKRFSVKDKIFMLYFSLTPLVFTIYHLAPTQYKFLDLLSLPVLVFSGLFLSQQSFFSTKKHWFKFLLAVFLIISLMMPVMKIKEFQESFSAFDDNYYPAALWLKDNRHDNSRILLQDESSIEKDFRGFSSELVFSMISEKYPLDGTISDLEVFSQDYKEQLEDRKELVNGNYPSMEKYRVKYIVGNNCPGEIIYSDDFTKICELS
ncbi:hypothetical protein ACFLTH_15890 [Bacteroidota bacterium]